MPQTTQPGDLPRTSWHGFLNSVTAEHQGADVTIEVLSLDFGDQQEAEHLPLFAIEYDHRDDVVVVSVGGREGRYPVVLRHIIRRPRRITVDPSLPTAALALDVIDADGGQTILTIHQRK
jgi:hypothetical protein